MKKILLLTSSLLCFLVFASLKADKDATTDYFVTNDGDTIKIKGSVNIDSQYLQYEDLDGKSHTIPQSNINKMMVAGRLFINLPILSLKMTRLQELIAYNKNYILTVYLDNTGYYLYVWNKKLENKEDKIWIGGLQHDMFIGTKKNQQKVMDKYIRKYFGGCKELMTLMKTNIEADKMFSDAINNYLCLAPPPTE